MLLRLALASCVTAVLLTAAASPALAGTREKILQECQDGRLSGDYTAKEIRDARDHIPTDIDQYSDCRDVLSRALAAKAGGGGSGGSGGGAGGGGGGGTSGGSGGSGGGLLTPASPSDNNALTNAARAGGGAVDVGGSQIAPSLAADTSRNQLPTVVIVVLALLALAAGVGAAP